MQGSKFQQHLEENEEKSKQNGWIDQQVNDLTEGMTGTSYRYNRFRRVEYAHQEQIEDNGEQPLMGVVLSRWLDHPYGTPCQVVLGTLFLFLLSGPVLKLAFFAKRLSL